MAAPTLQARTHPAPSYTTLLDSTQALAAQIQAATPATVRPATPHAAMFHVHLDVPAAAAARAHEELMRQGEPGLTLRIRTSPNPRHCYFETTIGPNALAITPEMFAEHVRSLITLATHLDTDPHPRTDDPGTGSRTTPQEIR